MEFHRGLHMTAKSVVPRNEMIGREPEHHGHPNGQLMCRPPVTRKLALVIQELDQLDRIYTAAGLGDSVISEVQEVRAMLYAQHNEFFEGSKFYKLCGCEACGNSWSEESGCNSYRCGCRQIRQSR